MGLEKIANNIIVHNDGIYYSKFRSNISYPGDGNQRCLLVENESFWFNHRNRVVINLVKRFSPNKRLFDIGGGNGFVSKGLQDAGIDVVLVEPGLDGVLNGKNRGIKNIICSTLDDAGFGENSLESVGLFDVIEHIENDSSFLNSIYNYLSSDGYLYITAPSFQFLWSDEDKSAGHYRRYTLKKLINLLIGNQFKVLYSTYFFSILPIPIFLFRSIPCLFGFHKTTKNMAPKNEHVIRSRLSLLVLNSIWNWELSQIEKSGKLSFGASCFVVAQKQ